MTLERRLQINIAALTVVGALLLGLGQHNPLLPALSLFAAATSVYFTDALGWFRLHRLIANLAALAALFISMREFDIFGGNSATQLRAIANLLVYLQFVLLYQEKNQRVYWQLVVLSLLQVVVAAALDLQVGLGLLLIVYMFTALSAMALLFVHSQIEPLQEPPRRTLAGGAWEMGGASWTPTAAPQTVRQCSPAALENALLGWSFLRRLAGIGVATWALALVVFLATPRLGNAVWRGANYGGARSVGFSREIRLGQMSEILQNEKSVMRVTLSDVRGAPLQLEHPPYFRGAVLSSYHLDGDYGVWSQPYPSEMWRLAEVAAPPPGDTSHARFMLEPSGSPTLFSVAPAYRDEDTPPDVRYDVLDEQLVRSEITLPLRALVQEYRYSIATTGIRNRIQVPLWPSRAGPDDVPRREWEFHHERLLRWNRIAFLHTAELAEKILRDASVSSRDRYQAAKTLEGYFLRPGLFTYTLDSRRLPPRPRNVDPIEHFLVNHRHGHCEYFAGALVMMLRSQGIPARIVVGYHGGEYNSLGKFYHVRQRDAHAWVEAYLEPDEIPRELRGFVPRNASGAWLRLDPTPSAPEPPPTGALRQVADAANYLEALWNDYVLGLTSDRQRQTVYRPFQEWARSTANKVKELATGWDVRTAWRDFAHAFVYRLGLDRPDAGAPWRTLGFVAVAGGLLAALLRFAWKSLRTRPWGRRWLRGWTVRRTASGLAAARRVPFYLHLEKILARRRYRRPPSKTPREFAAQLCAHWAASPTRREAGTLVVRIVEAFYRVRFGGHPLDSQEAQAIEKALDELERTLAKPGA